MTNPICPKTSAPMHRDVRSMPLTYKGESITFDMPGCIATNPMRAFIPVKT